MAGSTVTTGIALAMGVHTFAPTLRTLTAGVTTPQATTPAMSPATPPSRVNEVNDIHQGMEVLTDDMVDAIINMESPRRRYVSFGSEAQDFYFVPQPAASPGTDDKNIYTEFPAPAHRMLSTSGLKANSDVRPSMVKRLAMLRRSRMDAEYPARARNGPM